jgi:hypothetical protein
LAEASMEAELSMAEGPSMEEEVIDENDARTSIK